MHIIQKTYKQLGQTPKQVLASVEKDTGEKFFHTGTLDVMAEGLLVLVNSKLRFLEKYFKRLKKQYEFEVILGLCTDTHDLLGLIQKTSKLDSPSDEKVYSALKQVCKNKKQVPPRVSYKNLSSAKKLNHFLNGGALKELPAKKVNVSFIKPLYTSSISSQDLYQKLESSTKLINLNYRQGKVLVSYTNNKTKLPTKLRVLKYKIKVSSGFYIRALARDLSKELNYPCTVYSIKRTKVGPFSLVVK